MPFEMYSVGFCVSFSIREPFELSVFRIWMRMQVSSYSYPADMILPLDRNEGIENDILFVACSPDELYEKKLTNQQLYAAINSLPEKQAKRIYAYYFLDMDEPTIARAEGVSQQAVHSSVQRGLRRIEKFLKEFF